jgi:hypothetical protein
LAVSDVVPKSMHGMFLCRCSGSVCAQPNFEPWQCRQ